MDSLLQIALGMLLHKRLRFLFTVAGIGTLFLLSSSQMGLLVGWCNTISAIMRHADVDVWVMAGGTQAWDYGTAIPRQRIMQTRNVPGVAWAEGMYVGWGMWQRQDGRRTCVCMVGLDESSVGGPWHYEKGSVDVVHLPDTVIVDEMFLSPLGVGGVGDEVEIYGEKAKVGAISREVRTFTASPFVFTSMNAARRYDASFYANETTYVLVRCAAGANPRDVAAAIENQVPSVEALTTSAFIWRSISFWMVETGMGLTVILTAVLGVGVSSIVTSQTLFTITQEHLANYATLSAIGFSRRQLLACVVIQGLVLGTLGIALGSLGFMVLSDWTARTPVPLETTPLVFAGLVMASLGGCLLGALLSLKAIVRVDPVSVFRG